MFNILIEMTIKFIQLLIAEYKNERIDFENFIVHTSTKIKFVQENKENIRQKRLKLLAEDTIKKYEEIVGMQNQ